jgi:polyhydroxyalkanoate synthesis regulator phasin
MGYYSESTGDYSTAIGDSSIASGINSIVLGSGLHAKSYSESVLGSYNHDYTPNSADSWFLFDRLFVIANGEDEDDRSNALTILKNGRMGLQSVRNPDYALELPNNSNNGIGKARAYAWIIYSDGRLKSNREKLSYGLNEIMQIEPVQYFHHFSQKDESGILEILNEGNNDFGFIAQDMYKIIPEMVSKPEDDTNELWGINYEKLVPVLVKAMQEQQQIIEEQNKRIDNYETQINQQNEKITELEAKNNELDELKRRLEEIEKLIK